MEKLKLYAALSLIVVVFGILIYGSRAIAPRLPRQETPIRHSSGEYGSEGSGRPCVQVASSVFDCTERQIRDRIYYETEGGKKPLPWMKPDLPFAPLPTSTTMKVSVSMYSRKDSCHNRIGAVCLTAIGRDVLEGVTVACPRGVRLGTKVVIHDGPLKGSYTCEDRTAKWVEEKFGPTIDVFTEDYSRALTYGRHESRVSFAR